MFLFETSIQRERFILDSVLNRYDENRTCFCIRKHQIKGELNNDTQRIYAADKVAGGNRD